MRPGSAEELRRRIADKDGLLPTGSTAWDACDPRRLARLKACATSRRVQQHRPLAPATSEGIRSRPYAGVLRRTTADHDRGAAHGRGRRVTGSRARLQLSATSNPKNSGSMWKCGNSGRKIGMKMIMISVHSSGQPRMKDDELREDHELDRRHVGDSTTSR